MSIQNPLDDIMNIVETVYNYLVDYWWITLSAIAFIIVIVVVMIFFGGIPFL